MLETELRKTNDLLAEILLRLTALKGPEKRPLPRPALEMEGDKAASPEAPQGLQAAPVEAVPEEAETAGKAPEAAAAPAVKARRGKARAAAKAEQGATAETPAAESKEAAPAENVPADYNEFLKALRPTLAKITTEAGGDKEKLFEIVRGLLAPWGLTAFRDVKAEQYAEVISACRKYEEA